VDTIPLIEELYPLPRGTPVTNAIGKKMLVVAIRRDRVSD